MVRCVRCCLSNLMFGMNVVVTLCGVAMIIYSLWLEKMWERGLSFLPSIVNLPKPWFLYACFAVGIAVCFSTLFGHMIATCMSNSTLCIYLVTLASLLFLEAAVLVMIFFKIDWSKLIAEYIDEHHLKFRSFVEFHVRMIRVIVFAVLALQILIALFAIGLWTIGTEPRMRHRHRVSSVPDFKHSFLVGPIPGTVPQESIPVQSSDQALPIQLCSKCGDVCGRNPQESLLSYAKAIILSRFRRRTTVIDGMNSNSL